ncbi:FUSC family protein [Mycobacterium fragae]|uniref:Integral membrane bound transporter domain-containing protein n=1 Tax=Mycobacterium fragae TaxID=1260918 RepID=A0A1X1UT48_9MYCO|nr:FUSC family protein [Mycobacterium fragae]MCV7402202.1 FUSC family protein [Mycobacterium fragae]ORV59871.1 hypothetical protein AWC06_15815 [Mycobacterium fragae]
MSIAVLYARARNWAIGTDPGLLRLRMACRTTAALASALLILFLLTRATGQPLTVALLGVVITMVSARSVNEPDPRRQRITMALLPLPAAAAITAAALLAPHVVAADVMFVLIVFIAVYIRRFGTRGTALGMVTFMSYFFSLYLRANAAELPWLIGAVMVGAVCSFAWSTYLLPDRPEGVLRRTVRSLRARMAIVVDTTAEAVQAGRLDERRRRRLRIRAARLNETALMVQSQIEERVNPGALWPGVSGEDLALWLFDAELTVERLATAGARAAAADIPAAARTELTSALLQLSRAIRTPQPEGLRQAADLAQRLVDPPSDPAADPAVRRLALAVTDTARAASEVRARIERVAAQVETSTARMSDEPEQARPGLRPTTRQAIQVAVAASLAIVVGESVSPARWYWAVIAAFVVFAGTNTWGETLTKGWQRLLGTALGVPSGVLVATLVSGNTAASLVMIFVCLFCAFYFMKVTYSLMTFWITTMLALLYGLLGQFTYHLLLLRIEETAIGAVIGVAVAMLVLPVNTRTTIRNDARTFFTTLSDVIEASVATMFGDRPAASLTETARQLDRDLQQFRNTAKPLTAGLGGLAGRRSMRHGLRMLTACDRYARVLARSCDRYDEASPDLAGAVRSAAAQIRRNIDVLITALEFNHPATVFPATDFLDAAESEQPDSRRLRAALHALRQIDRAVITAATDLGAQDVVAVAASATN